MDLTIETKDKNRAGDIINAYNDALKTTNLNDFIKSLSINIGCSNVGRGGNHIYISEKSGARIAIITNI